MAALALEIARLERSFHHATPGAFVLDGANGLKSGRPPDEGADATRAWKSVSIDFARIWRRRPLIRAQFECDRLEGQLDRDRNADPAISRQGIDIAMAVFPAQATDPLAQCLATLDGASTRYTLVGRSGEHD
jgi:hypothetical protein